VGRAYTGRVGDWYWIGLAVGLGAGLGVLCAGALAATRTGTFLAVALAAGGGLLIGLGLGDWGEAIGGAIGGVLGVGGSAQFVQGALRRGGTHAATAIWVALGALVIAALALIPVVGYLEAAALPVIGARLRTRAPKKYAGLRSLAK
jgi:hypothetical protein